MERAQPKLDFEIDFLLIPSLEEVQDHSGEDVYMCSLAPLYESAIALENERRDLTRRGGDIQIHRVSDPDEPMTAGNAPSEVILTMAAWLGSAAGISLFYKLLKTWMGMRKGRKIALKLPGGLHIQTTQLSPRQFSELLQNLANVGLVVYKDIRRGSDRITAIRPDKEKAFETFFKSLSANGADILDEDGLRKIERPLRIAFSDAMGAMRYGPDFEERCARAEEKRKAREQLPLADQIPYLSSMQKEVGQQDGAGRSGIKSPARVKKPKSSSAVKPKKKSPKDSL